MKAKISIENMKDRPIDTSRCRHTVAVLEYNRDTIYAVCVVCDSRRITEEVPGSRIRLEVPTFDGTTLFDFVRLMRILVPRLSGYLGEFCVDIVAIQDLPERVRNENYKLLRVRELIRMVPCPVMITPPISVSTQPNRQTPTIKVRPMAAGRQITTPATCTDINKPIMPGTAVARSVSDEN